MSTYEWISIGLAVVGLLGLWRYVRHTRTMAEATKQQGAVLSFPTVSVLCETGKTPRQPFSRIITTIRNTSRVHAYARIKLKLVLHTSGTDQSEDFPAPPPYDGTIWPFAAGQGFDGNFTIKDLQARSLNEGDTLTLVGTIHSSAYGEQDNFRENPPVYYRWNDSKKLWIPDISPARA